MVHHELCAAILECWQTEVSRSQSGAMSLKQFVESKPDWDLIVKLSKDIAQKYVGMTQDLLKSYAKPEAECHETTDRAARLERVSSVTLVLLASNGQVSQGCRRDTLEDFATLPRWKGQRDCILGGAWCNVGIGLRSFT